MADDLALEILAPGSELTAAISSMEFSESLKVARRVAERRFGLPKGIADRYSQVGSSGSRRAGRPLRSDSGSGFSSEGVLSTEDRKQHEGVDGWCRAFEGWGE